MLSNDQCIEVAEKVWGWSNIHIDPDANDGRSWKVTAGDYSTCLKEDQLVDFLNVNSWAGFGRTVEAIEESGMVWDIKKFAQAERPYSVKLFGTIVLDGRRYINDSVQSGVIGASLIEATHLAALEAIK